MTSDLLLIASLGFLLGLPVIAFAQQPLISFPSTGESEKKPVIDGVWTSADEWSMASETIINYTDGTRLVTRGMYDSDAIYLMLEMPKDNQIDGHAAACFDTRNDGGAAMNSDDYCFVLGNELKEYRGDGRTTLMQQTTLSRNIGAQRGLSGTNSPYYSGSDHVSYEFNVPLDHLGSDSKEYGFYITYDTRGQTDNYTHYYSWPESGSPSYLRVAPPRSWGMVSLLPAGAEVPEFPLPALGAIAGIIGIVAMLTRRGIVRT